MDNKELYIKEINQIFSCLAKLKTNFSDNDNINFISNLEKYKQDAIDFLKTIEEVSNND